MKIYLGADHRGFKLKEGVKNWLISLGYEVYDMGAYKYDAKDDYTLYAQKVAVVVRAKKGRRGILFCGSGVGVDVVANKFDGIRASIGKSSGQIAAGRKHDDMNVLVLASDFTTEAEAKEIIKRFLETKFDKKKRYIRRLKEIQKLEINN